MDFLAVFCIFLLLPVTVHFNILILQYVYIHFISKTMQGILKHYRCSLIPQTVHRKIKCAEFTVSHAATPHQNLLPH